MKTPIQAFQDVREALAKLPKGSAKPKRVFVGPDDYSLLHEAAEEHGVTAPKHPEREEQRLECAGMKVHCHESDEITFE